MAGFFENFLDFSNPIRPFETRYTTSFPQISVFFFFFFFFFFKEYMDTLHEAGGRRRGKSEGKRHQLEDGNTKLIRLFACPGCVLVFRYLLMLLSARLPRKNG